jgi:PhnB protein
MGSYDAIFAKDRQMRIQPYLFFDGRCEEALEFYSKTLGAEDIKLLRFKDAPKNGSDAPEGCCPIPSEPMPSGAQNKVMHASFRIGDSTIHASDGMCQGNPSFKGIALTLHAHDATEAERLFAAIADGGQIQMPMTTTFFSPRFGMAEDRFGVSWMVVIDH